MSGNLERRYRRVLRLLPGSYRERWQEEMTAAFLDSWLTGDADADAYISKAAGPSWGEITSVAGLAMRLYLNRAGTARRYLPRGQVARYAVLAVTVVQAMRGLSGLVAMAWSRHLFGWVPAPPASMMASGPAEPAQAVFYVVGYGWVVVFVLLVLGYYRPARVVAALAIVPDLVVLLQHQFNGRLPTPSAGAWAFWVLINLAPVLAMSAFHRDAPSPARWPWLLALPVGYLVVYAPLLALQATGNSAWVPDFSGLYCILVAIACLAHAPRIWFGQVARSGLWSRTLVLLAVDAGAYRIFSITDYLQDPHLIDVSLSELLILLISAALVAPDVRARVATTGLPAHPHTTAA